LLKKRKRVRNEKKKRREIIFAFHVHKWLEISDSFSGSHCFDDLNLTGNKWLKQTERFIYIQARASSFLCAASCGSVF